jgi:hypothetical protein
MSVGVTLLRASRSETEADAEVIEAIAEVDLAISFPVFESEMLDRIDWFVIASLQKIQMACTEEFARVKRSPKGSWSESGCVDTSTNENMRLLMSELKSHDSLAICHAIADCQMHRHSDEKCWGQKGNRGSRRVTSLRRNGPAS